MRADSIQAMLADPHIDPTSWVGKALLQWVDENPLECLKDSVARKYLFMGMDVSDIKTLVPGVISIYKESQDATVIQKFTQACNNVTRRTADDYNLRWALSTVARSYNPIADANTVDHIIALEMPDGDDGYPGDLTNHLKDYHIKPLLRNRKPQWGVSGWGHIVDAIPKKELLEMTTKEIWPKHLRDVENRSRSWPGTVQSVLWKIFLRLPSAEIPQWIDFLRTTVIGQIWQGKETKALISKKRGGALYFTQLVCRCGVVAANKSGYTCHRRVCSNSDDPSLFLAAKVCMASNSSLLICTKCARTCRSKPGLALHMKKCKSELGEKVRAARELQEKRELYVDTTPNPVS
ncbi:MAG: hypothetical protein ACW99J_18480 [Candidatus Thorarchaeota archaeon]|jgi:hypothetical protein